LKTRLPANGAGVFNTDLYENEIVGLLRGYEHVINVLFKNAYYPGAKHYGYYN